MSVAGDDAAPINAEMAENEQAILEEAETDQYLTFIMDEEEYGVDILSVQEIRGWESVTPIPNSPDHVKGVINLRGTIVPIIDLRLRFGFEKVVYGPLTVVIVLKVANKKVDRIMGVVVDAVSDVYDLVRSEMREPPDLGDHINTSYIYGLVNVSERLLILLNIDELLGSDAIPEIRASDLKELSANH